MAVLAFLVTIACVPWWPDGANSPRWIVLSIAIPALLLVAKEAPRPAGLWLLYVFAAWAGLSLAWSPSVLDGLEIYWHFLLLVALAVLAATHRFDLKWVYLGSGLALAINSLLVIAQVGHWIDLPGTSAHSGLFFNRVFAAEAAAMVIVGTLWAQRQWIFAFVPTMSLQMFYPAVSRGALAGLGAAVLVALWTRVRFCTFLMLILLAGLAFHVSSYPGKLVSVSERLIMWQLMVNDLGFWGYGLGATRFMTPYFEYAHNDLLQVLYETGVPGTLLLFGFFGYCLWRGALRERCVLVAFLVIGCFGFPLFMPVTAFLAACAAGALCRDRAPVCGLFNFGQLRDRYRQAILTRTSDALLCSGGTTISTEAELSNAARVPLYPYGA